MLQHGDLRQASLVRDAARDLIQVFQVRDA